MSWRQFIALGTLAASMVVPVAAAAPIPPSVKPQAPSSPWISSADERALRGVFAALDDRDYKTANALRPVINDPVVRSVADWAYLRSRDKAITAKQIDAFLDRHYEWPNETLLRGKAEKTFDEDTPIREIFDFFDERDPLTGNGHLQLARAFLALKNEDAATAQLQTAWVDYDWSASNERKILSQYGKYLTPEDHWAKVDRQLFEIKASATERLLSLLPTERRREAQARIAFLKQDGNAPALYNSLPQDSANDSGVLLAATRYYRRTDQDDKAVLFAGLAPLDRDALRNPDRWFVERKLLARWALKTGRFEDAYTLSAYSGLEEGATFAEAEFMAGWTALRFLNDPERAKAHFAFLATGVTSPISRSRGAYWLARAFEAAGDDATASQHYRVAAAYPFTYYGQLAIESLGDGAPIVPFPPSLEADENDKTIFEARPLVHAMRILSEVGESTHFDRFARALDDQIEAPGEVAAYHDLVMEERKTYLAVRAGKVARNNGAEVPSVIYPLITVPDAAARFVETPLILGLSRQESEFNPRAYSRAKAQGLMQLLTSTARITARKEGIPFSQPRLFSDPNYNLIIGAAHLSHLLERFDGSYIMVLAGYNAGPHRVKQWVETYGDPRLPDVDPIDWVELIPFSETRNYVMRVLENTQVYRARLNGTPMGQLLSEDLVRGGNTQSAFGNFPPAPKLWDIQYTPADPAPSLLNRPAAKPLALARFEALEFPPLAAETEETTN